jgi:hypothetical protein
MRPHRTGGAQVAKPDQIAITAEDIERIGEIARRHGNALVADLMRKFPGREPYAVATALALLFTSSMTTHPAQQTDQARILNEIMMRWHDYVVPWRLVPAE